MSIRIYRSTGASAPSTLAEGQLAYSFDNAGSGANAVLRIGAPGSTQHEIGGKKYVDLVNDLDTNFQTRTQSALNNLSVGQHSDVDLTGVSDGQTLVWVAANNRFEPQAPSTGVTTFIALNDTPSSFAANSYLKVNAAGTAVEQVTDIDDGTF